MVYTICLGKDLLKHRHSCYEGKQLLISLVELWSAGVVTVTD